MTKHTAITAHDIMSLDAFQQARPKWRERILSLKKNRRIPLGPDVTLYFENRETLLWQIQEMLLIEKGGEEQLKDEIEAYSPMVPNGSELVATMMIEIEDIERRRHTLAQLGHIEYCVTCHVDAHTIKGIAAEDLDRTDPSGKTSAVHFLHFPFSQEEKEAFLASNAVTFSVNHPRYSYTTAIKDSELQSLQSDMR